MAIVLSFSFEKISYNFFEFHDRMEDQLFLNKSCKLIFVKMAANRY